MNSTDEANALKILVEGRLSLVEGHFLCENPSIKRQEIGRGLEMALANLEKGKKIIPEYSRLRSQYDALYQRYQTEFILKGVPGTSWFEDQLPKPI